ncbi:cysteine hydrolase family protein [Ruminiclostridium cellobioparum]|uniref:cysteine hydrolase family protein n=1 Tax=Ruminiclostridium cellobioparum TaxID=29355 RepID=UPI0028A99306|nr:cysteine hydrolase family protein [Ruminiclostridium cellobioparum]
MKETALLIIDVQVAMFSYENEYPHNGDAVLNNIREMLFKARENNIPVIFVQHTAADEYQKDTATWQICPEITPLEQEYVVQKTQRDSFYNTNLKEILDGLGITKLIIAGMQTEFCVDTTCRTAYSAGYELTLVRDAHTTFDSPVLPAEQIIRHHNGVLKGIAGLKTTKEILQQMAEID